MVRSTGRHDLVATGILDAAADLLAAGGELPSMAQVADAAGVGRATLYRYFPTRDELVTELTARTLGTAKQLIEDAELDSVPLAEGLARFARVMFNSRAQIVVIERASQVVGQQLERRADARAWIGSCVLGLFVRGLADGVLRPDLTAEQHLRLFASLLRGSVQMVAEGLMPAERAAAVVVSTYLSGAGA